MSSLNVVFVTVTGTTTVPLTAAVSQALHSAGEVEPVIVTVFKTTTVASTYSAAPAFASSTLATSEKIHASVSGFRSFSESSIPTVTSRSATSSQQSQRSSHSSTLPRSSRTEQPPVQSLPTSSVSSSPSSIHAHNSTTSVQGSDSSSGGKIALYIVLPAVLFIIAAALVILTILWCKRKCTPRPDLEAARRNLGTTPAIIAQNEQARRERINEYAYGLPVAESARTGSLRGSSRTSQTSKATAWPSPQQGSRMPEDQEPAIILQPVEVDLAGGLPPDDVATYPMRLDRDFYSSDNPGAYMYAADHGATNPGAAAVGESAFAGGRYARHTSVEEAERRARIHMNGIFPSGGVEVEEYVEMKKKAAMPGEDAEIWNWRAEKLAERLVKLRQARSPNGVGFEGVNFDEREGLAGLKKTGWRNLLRV